MSTKRRLRSLLLISALGMGLLAGSPMTPAEIDELFSRISQRSSHTLRQEDEGKKNKRLLHLYAGVRRW